MPLTFTGGQALPTVGTAAYSAAQQGNGAGNFNANTGTLTANNQPLYTPPSSTPGSPKATTPVVTSQAAQNDYNAKYASYQLSLKAMQDQSNSVAQQKAVQDSIEAQKALHDSATNLQQQGIDIQKAQADAQNAIAQAKLNTSKALGSDTTGQTSTTPATPTTSTSTTTSPPAPTTPANSPSPAAPATNVTSTNNDQISALTTEQQQLQNIQSQKDQIYSNIQRSLTSILQGTIPLSPSQSALITSLQTQLQNNVAVQTQVNQANVGAATEAAFRSGGEYTPVEMANTIQSAVTLGVGRIQELDNSAAKTMADLENSFQKQNFDEINKSYDTLLKQLDDKSTAIKDTYTQVSNLMKDQRDYQMNVDKFNQTKDQNAFDNAFKMEQEKFAESKANATEAETARHNKETEAINSFKAGMGAGNNNGIGANIKSTPMAADGKPDPVAQKQTLDNIAQTYGPMTAVAIKGLADYSINPADWRAGAAKGMTRDQAVTLAKMVDPTYNDSMFPARSAYLKNLTSGPMANGVVSANKAINHLIAFTSSVENLGNGPVSSTLNGLAGIISTPLSGIVGGDRQKILSTAETEANGLKDEMGKFFKGTGSVDVKSIDDWSKTLDVNATPGQLNGVVQGSINLLAGQLDVMNQQYTTTMGKPPEGQILQPQTIQKLSDLKNHGYQVNIPGVYYTDPKAYINANPDGAKTIDSLHASHPELTPAQTLQLAQYLQENGQ